jgi:hypothetical protein
MNTAIGFVLGIFTAAFIYDKKFRTALINGIKRFAKWARTHGPNAGGK